MFKYLPVFAFLLPLLLIFSKPHSTSAKKKSRNTDDMCGSHLKHETWSLFNMSLTNSSPVLIQFQILGPRLFHITLNYLKKMGLPCRQIPVQSLQ